MAAPDKKAERRATAGSTTSRLATPRAAMQQLPTNLEHDAGTPTEATLDLMVGEKNSGAERAAETDGEVRPEMGSTSRVGGA